MIGSPLVKKPSLLFQLFCYENNRGVENKLTPSGGALGDKWCLAFGLLWGRI
jgi:hypothetical protein